jgi:alkyldihydroxyacetonephosphate synthase
MVLARPTSQYPEMSSSGWGDASQVPALSDAVHQLLKDGLGVSAPAADSAPAQPRPASLSTEEIAAIAVIVGEENLAGDDATRLLHARGKSTPDLLRTRAGGRLEAPDAVAYPASHEEVLEVLRACSERRIAVVPFGGGTSVVGGLAGPHAGFKGVVALDLRRLNGLLALDEESCLAELEPGLRGPEAEALLGERGYTIGHFPQSFQYGTLGGFAAARSSGQASAGYGRFDELVMKLRVATPVGTLELGRAPKSAAGPDLRQLILGSEGAFGVITALGVAIRAAPEQRVYEGWRFASFAGGSDALRVLVQEGPLPTVLRLSDEAETALNLARPTELGGAAEGGALAVVGYEGTGEFVDDLRARAGAVLREAGGQLEPDAGHAWAHDRYHGPYLRDALLEAGALVETLETATFWSGLAGLYAAVSDALRAALTAQGTPPVILCHISHVYRTGASLYFTVGCAQTEDPLSQWQRAKDAAGDAIVASAATITHHHGIGRDHLRFYEQELGPLGVKVLRAVKTQLDPAGILNPGALLRT